MKLESTRVSFFGWTTRHEIHKNETINKDMCKFVIHELIILPYLWSDFDQNLIFHDAYLTKNYDLLGLIILKIMDDGKFSQLWQFYFDSFNWTSKLYKTQGLLEIISYENKDRWTDIISKMVLLRDQGLINAKKDGNRLMKISTIRVWYLLFVK